MSARNITYSALIALFLLGCRPSPIGEDGNGEHDTAAQEEVMTTACEELCNRAVECSVEIAQTQWGFETHSECLADCISYTESYRDDLERPDCVDPYIDLWNCGGRIQDCEDFVDFVDFENATFTGRGPAAFLCKEEVSVVLDNSCT